MTDAALTGRIMKATGGFYYVDVPHDGGIRRVECRGKGILRKRGDTPLVGDMVRIEPTGEGGGALEEILPRNNSLVRPPLSNLDRMVLVISVTDPPPNLLVADTYLAVLAYREIGAVIALTKTDLADPGCLEAIYAGAGFEVVTIDTQNPEEGTEKLRGILSRGISAFCGNSGVGKSTLLNRIDGRLGLATGETSKKLGRGRHTTRIVELLELPEGGLVADTPGFSSVEMLQMGHIPKEDIHLCFIEFATYFGKCRFADCAHIVEKGCAVLDALEKGEIHPSRHKSYVQLYNQAKEVREWERK